MMRFLGAATYTDDSDFGRLIERTKPAVIPESFLVFVVVGLDGDTVEAILRATHPGQRSMVIVNLEDDQAVRAAAEGPQVRRLRRCGALPLLYDGTRQTVTLSLDGGAHGQP